jgi:AraC family transcriptional regulator, regulatory protein of adaptative response / DNA-3-methyladenine glycosylase II
LTVELSVTPQGPYSLSSSARIASDATRTFRDGLFTQVLDVEGRIEVARAWQLPQGAVTIHAQSVAGAERLRWILALDDDHSEFLRQVRDDPMLGAASRLLRGLRPVRVPTVAQALLRAFCGQLIEAKVARRLEQTIIRTICRAGPERLHVSPTTRELAALAPAQLRALGLHTRRGAALVRLCRSLDLERLHVQPTEAVARRLERERGLGPWSVGVVCLQGLGRNDYGLVGDLGLVKLLRAVRGRPVEGWETAELLEPYGRWAGLASVYLLAAFGRGLLPVGDARAA